MKEKLVLEKAAEEGLALTFDDVRLKTKHSEIMPDEVNIESKFSKNINLKIPVVSASMDTVTESDLAIELAKLGGIGVIHRSMSIDDQASQVARVKNHLNGFIENPICVYEDESISNIIEMRENKKYPFHSFPVLNKDEKLVGLITSTHFEFCVDKSKTAKEIMTKDVFYVKEIIDIEEAYKMMHENKKKILPIVTEEKEIKGLYVFSDVTR
ncbi:MAG: IMP dehydrogenase, partial [Minisyncoccales bacterium]